MVIFRVAVRDAEVVHPSSETESAFLRSYTLTNAMKSGIPFEYATGSIKGTVTVDPLVVQDSTSVAGKVGLPSGQTAFKLRVRISETWHKASAGCL